MSDFERVKDHFITFAHQKVAIAPPCAATCQVSAVSSTGCGRGGPRRGQDCECGAGRGRGDTGDGGRCCCWCCGMTGVVGWLLGLFAGGDIDVGESWLYFLLTGKFGGGN